MDLLEPYKRIQLVWEYKNRRLKGKKYRTVSKWSLSHHRNKCLSNLPNRSATEEEKLKQILPREKIKKKGYTTQGKFIVTGWFSKCPQCGKCYEFQGYDKDSLEYFQRISVFPVRKAYKFYSNKNAVNEMCSRCGSFLEYSTGAKEIILPKFSTGDRVLDFLSKIF